MPNRVIVIAGILTMPSIVSRRDSLAAHIVSVVAYEKESANCNSGGVTVIMLQDAAETMLAFDLGVTGVPLCGKALWHKAFR